MANVRCKYLFGSPLQIYICAYYLILRSAYDPPTKSLQFHHTSANIVSRAQFNVLYPQLSSQSISSLVLDCVHRMVIDSTRFLTLMLVGLHEYPGKVSNSFFTPDSFSIVLSKRPSIMMSGPRAFIWTSAEAQDTEGIHQHRTHQRSLQLASKSRSKNARSLLSLP
ncbi:uncharacterized protein P174DRAFT_248897 [Aspergillus novofumigatus IBT 16806]|uniref:Uncharacterized protein n=1 Tax=Aspergillus novofumigatus (strain IBT 16806) TaxID=1392255 RepID=A0A2I1C2B4_ASPN1|nr:uncharacterized protein P174DRAFT_248897 [Aspergillus novofumigatus IBT 16806]PKX91790.1 hypothetical protein P174DRAFT_248897 [Aspergillus novofumigatus IBT 16806]